MSNAKHPTNPNQLNLVSSERLRALRNKTGVHNIDKAGFGFAKPVIENSDEARLRAAIRQRLDEILASLPAGKQRSLFKIRYGMELDNLEHLPADQIAAKLKIKLAKSR